MGYTECAVLGPEKLKSVFLLIVLKLWSQYLKVPLQLPLKLRALVRVCVFDVKCAITWMMFPHANTPLYDGFFF